MALRTKDGQGESFWLDVVNAGTEADPAIFKTSDANEGPVKSLFYQRLSTNGDGTGTTNMAVNGSVTPQVFSIAPGAGEIMRVARIIVAVQDTGTFDIDKWGNGITMSTGLEFEFYDGTSGTNIFGTNILTHADMASTCHDANYQAWGTGDNFATFRLTFTRAGQPFRLVGDNGEEGRVTVNDDLTGLTNMYVVAQGFYE